MTTTIQALFDGQVFRPTTPCALKPNTSVKLTVETDGAIEAAGGKPQSFLETARNLRLVGPKDFSTNLHHYLYGEGSRSDAG